MITGPEELRRGSELRQAAAAKLASKNWISREVRAMDCAAWDSGMQAGVKRFDQVKCNVRVNVPCFLPGQWRKRECLEPVPRDFYIGTIFMDAKPFVPFPQPKA